MRLLVIAIIATSITATLIACGAPAGTEATAAAGGGPALLDTGDPLTCDLDGYAPDGGPAATMEQNTLLVTWAGAAGADLRLRLGLEDAAPVVRDLAIRAQGGAWGTLGRNLAPDFHVTSGVRRISYQQLNPLHDLGVEITREVIDREKWYVFWDAPLLTPGIREGESPGTNPDLPRSPDEIREASAAFNTTACTVGTDGSRLEVTFDGLSMGIFSGDLRFTVYEGTNLVRLEAIAATDEPSVAYKYRGGLKGFSTEHTARVAWRDISGSPLDYRFGGPANDDAIPLRAHNRIVIAEGSGGSVAAFPPPVTFFFTREVETNHGYNWYRNDGDGGFAIGVRQGDGEAALEGQALAPYGAMPRTDENTAVMGRFFENFALYNAPPGTDQRMAVYFYASPEAAEPTRDAALAFTHGDTFKPVPGFKTFVNHFHIRFVDRLRASGSLDTPIPDVQAIKALGIDIIGLSDFHADRLAGGDSGAARFKDQLDYYEGSRRASDEGFLVTPWEEPNAHFGGHYNTLFPKNVYFTRSREAGQPFMEEDPTYGTVYRTGSAEDLLRVLEEESGYWFHAHPRTKGSTGHPDAEIDTAWIGSDRYLGVAFKPGMGADQSAERMCEHRCFDAIDKMNNHFSGSGLMPKYLIADCDTYHKFPGDDIYPNVPVNYLRLDRVPGPDEDWTPILDALRGGDYFVTTGQVLITDYTVEGSGDERTIAADLEWTFPLEFVEVVWGDGESIDREIIRATDSSAFGARRFEIPFDAAGKSWVRFAAWDSAGNGAFVQPVWLTE
jgi:hypothetical protein